MSRTVVIMIVSWLSIFSVNEATLGTSCNGTEDCAETNEICTNGSCECSSGYFNVSDVCESDSITVTLTILSTSVVYGSDAILTATITSKVSVNPLKWLKGSTELVIAPPKYTQNGVGPDPVTLTIHTVNFDDTGVYQVEASNSAGTTSTSTQVSLTVTGGKPTAVVSGTITETGTTVTIRCNASGSPAVTAIHWLLNNRNLDISNNAKYTGGTVSNPSLSIKNVASTDAGEYRCRATNLIGSTTSTQSVTLEKPTVTVPGTITEINTTVTIHCTASVQTSSPALTDIHWLLNGGNLDISDSTKYTGATVSNPSLFIHKIASSDAGEYRCLATNLLGSTTSTASVTLAAPSVGTILQQPAGPVNHGSSVTFTGSYTSNLLSVSLIQWQKLNGSKFIAIDITADKYTGSSVTGPSPKLVINTVQFIDETSYRLMVSNGVGFSVKSSDVLDVTGGGLTVTTGPNVTGRYGGNVTVNCSIDGPEINKIQWKKYVNNLQHDITTGNEKYSGGSLSSPPLTINDLKIGDQSEYQCTAGNKGGEYGSLNKATVTVVFGQFNDGCTAKETCDSSKSLNCTNGKCLCLKDYYHNKEDCILKTGLAPFDIFLNSTTSWFSVFWSNPTTDFELVSKYEVTWRVTSASADSSGLLNRTINQYTAPSNLTAGQLYIVNVISHVTLTDPADDIVVTTDDRTVRTDPSAPGPVILSQSNLAHDNLQIKWTAPVNTLVTRYEVTVDGTTYTTMSIDPMYQFTGKVFVPGKWYIISIVTVSGTASDIVKRSSEHTERIRTTPTKPNPPTDLQCPQSPLDISLEISWTAPTEPNGLVLRYQINVSPENLQVYTTSNETHKNVGGLLQEQMYNFTVRTINDAAINDTSEPSEQINCTTKAGVSSSPTNLVLDEIQSRGFRIQFNRPDNVSGVLAAYKIVISEGVNCVQQILVHGHCSICMSTVGCPPPINYTVTDINNNDVSYSASGLDPYTHYMVKVVAINGNGEGHPVNTTVTTKEEVPLQPLQITASNIQSSSLTLAWTLPGPSPGNTTYTIYTYEGTDDIGTHFLMKKPTKVYGFDTKSVSLTNLEEYWPYKFTVDAATVKGNKTSNFSSVFRTEQDTPGKVLNLTIQKKGSDYKSAYVSWSPPALRDRNGVLQSYLFSNNHTGTMKEEEIPVSLSQAIVEKKIPVTPEAVYVVEVILQNNESRKSQTSMQIYEAPAGPPPVTDIQPVTTKPGQYISTENTITIDINTEYFQNDENGKQVFFGIAVCAESKCGDIYQNTFRSVWKGLPTWRKAGKEGFPLYRVTNDTFMDEVRPDDSRQKRSTISASTLTFTIGEDLTCSSLNEDVYCNGPLTAGTSYIVIIFACTNGGCTYNETAEPYATKKIEQKTDIPIGIISGAVVAVVVVLVIVGVAFVVVRRRNRLGETKQYQKGIDNPTTFDEPVPKNIPRKRPIKLKELSDKVADKHKDSNLHFAREYEDLKALSPKHIAETSELDSNKLKNRYVNILPFDHSRVKLMLTEDDDPSTDFINANYLPGYKSQREYIATQGPIPGTIDDFWRMIWEQNVSIIVMLTLCKEEGRVKCEMYWPENNHEPKQYGDLVVETVSNSTVNFYEFRIFKIKLGDTTRSVKHFHFLQWKDFSANVQNDVMIDFIKNVRNHIRPPDMNGPVVVHCSAGVGRTGTYCALDHLFQFVDEHDLDESIDIFDLVMNLRERRMFMVQTEQQYIFIHDCLKDYLEKKLSQGKDECLYENQAFVADDEPMEESLYQNYSNQRTDL